MTNKTLVMNLIMAMRSMTLEWENKGGRMFIAYSKYDYLLELLESFDQLEMTGNSIYYMECEFIKVSKRKEYQDSIRYEGTAYGDLIIDIDLAVVSCNWFNKNIPYKSNYNNKANNND